MAFEPIFFLERMSGMTKMRKPHSARLLQAAAIAALMMAVGAPAALADVNLSQATTEAAMPAARQAPSYLRVAGLFGESDEEKAARLAHEQNQDTQINQLNQQVSDLQQSITRLTGHVEMLDHRLDEANSRIDRMQKDFNYKICTMTAQQLGEDADSLNCGGTASASPSAVSPNNAPRLAPPPGVLGTIPSDQPLPLAAPGTPDAGETAASAAKPQFDAAMSLLAKSQYDEARAAFRNFADTYPQDPLAPQAVYWVGDIAYVQKDYANAARAFAEEIKKYGSSARAPESMLKLGQSLIAMKQKQEGCTTLGALPAKYPKASPNVLAQAKTARKDARCH
jgi:tol-pal system protein YbgF